MKLTKQKISNVNILDIQGEMDNYNNKQLKKAMEQVAIENDYRVVIQLSKVSYMEVVVAKTLLVIAQWLQEHGGGLFLVAVRSSVREVLENNIPLDYQHQENIFFDTIEEVFELFKI